MKSVRKCDNPPPRYGGSYCIGPRVQYRSCNIEMCPPDSREFREEQCSEFNGKDLNIPNVPQGVHWFPRYNGSKSKFTNTNVTQRNQLGHSTKLRG